MRNGLISLKILVASTVFVGCYNGSTRSLERISSISPSPTPTPAPQPFTMTGSLNESRVGAQAVVLGSGQVLVVGGNDGGALSATSEIYDPAAETFAVGPSLQTITGPSSLLLVNDGRALALGGFDSSTGQPSLKTEFYSPVTDSFSAGPDLNIIRYSGQAATLLANGYVLITGGWGEGCSYLSNMVTQAELLNPDGTAGLVGHMITPRAQHSATLIDDLDHRVLLAGGLTCRWNALTGWRGVPTAEAEVYFPATDDFISIGSLNHPRYGHSAMALSDGSIAIVGGFDENGQPVREIEIFDSATDSFSVSGTADIPGWTSSVLLQNGNLMSFTGSDPVLIDPLTAEASSTGPMLASRSSPLAVLLDSGNVLIMGGNSGTGLTCELYSP